MDEQEIKRAREICDVVTDEFFNICEARTLLPKALDALEYEQARSAAKENRVILDLIKERDAALGALESSHIKCAVNQSARDVLKDAIKENTQLRTQLDKSNEEWGTTCAKLHKIIADQRIEIDSVNNALEEARHDALAFEEGSAEWEQEAIDAKRERDQFLSELSEYKDLHRQCTSLVMPCS